MLETSKNGAAEEERRALTLELAALAFAAARKDEALGDRLRRKALARLCADESGQAFVSAIGDRAHRTRAHDRAADTVRTLIERLGVPKFLPLAGRAPLALVGAGIVPDALTVAGIERGVRLSAHGLVHDAEGRAVQDLVETRRREHTTVNVNLVGEVVLGEREAEQRAEAYRTLIEKGDANAVSIKLSSIASQISLSAYAQTLAMLEPRLRMLYLAACAREPHVLVNLDMEAFDDLELTFELHQRLAEDPALRDLVTGVVLQAYLPDVHARYEALLTLAKARAARGWAPLRVRIVKGANLAMERHLAALRGHPLPLYRSKSDTDASWLALVERAVRAENAKVLRVGVASHNVFDLSFALCARAAQGTEAFVELEMLEGMANPERRIFAALAGSMLVYAPIVSPSEFDAAIAYLVRRLEEATTPGHFLRDAFAMKAFDARYEAAKASHETASKKRSTLETTSFRAHEKSTERTRLDDAFVNETDTDWAVAAQRMPILRAVRAREQAEKIVIASLVRGHEVGERVVLGKDPSRPAYVPYEARMGDAAVVHEALRIASASAWPRLSARERAEHLLDLAAAMRRARADLVATMVLDAGKRIVEADVEVSEAIDFAEYYARSAVVLAEDRRIHASPLGTVLVASPWNFPLAIGAGGVMGALAAGNTVLLKPSSKTPLVAFEFVRLAHAAGIPTEALGLLLIDDVVAREVVCDPHTQAVVLTGSTATARTIRALRPSLPLFAETGGKNAMVVTALADRDLAIRDAVASAFGHAGQKCSATSLLVCEREVYEDEGFRERLIDAASSLPVGSAWDEASVVTPLIGPPSGPLARALETLEQDETWLLPPRRFSENPSLVGPSIKLGVRADGFTHQTELFGPVLAMMCADDLDHAITIANGTPYGLTGAIHSLDPREQEQWLTRMNVGNAYVNRGTTGAIVRRQPFGGTKASCFGPGAKAGGPSYVRQLSRVTDGEPATERAVPSASVHAWIDLAARGLDESKRASLAHIAELDAAVYRNELGRPSDPSAITTQRNIFSRVPRRSVVLMISDEASQDAVLRTGIAAHTAGVSPAIAFLGHGPPDWVRLLADHVTLLPARADEETFAARFRALPETTFVVIGLMSEIVLSALARADKRVLHAYTGTSAHDAITVWLEERSTTLEDHRYGQPLPESLRARFPDGAQSI